MQEIYDEIYKYNEICDNMCDEYRDCSDCIVCKFKNKYDINIEDNCEAVYIAINLLGYNASTAEYIKEQYKNMKSNLCAKRKCNDCFIHDINRAKCYDMFCFQIYVGLNLLKEV